MSLRNTFGSLFLTLATLAQAENNCSSRQDRAIEKNTLSDYQAVLASPPNTRWGGYVELDALYWLPREEGLEFAYKQSSSDSSGADAQNPLLLGNTVKGRFNRIKFDWQGAFRLEAGYRLPVDDWRAFARWTRLCESVNGLATATSTTTEALAAIWLGAEFFSEGYLNVLKAEANWNLHYNVLDGGVGRTFNWGSRLQITPEVGIRGFWINQRFRVNYSGGNITAAPATFKGINNFGGAGLFGQMNTKWFFARQWAILGEFLGSINFGRQRLSQQTHSQIQLTSVIPLRYVIDEIVQRTRFAYQAAIGVEWSSYFSACNKQKLSFSVLYELSEWIHLNQLRRFAYSNLSSVANFVPMEGTLGFQGVSITGRYDY